MLGYLLRHEVTHLAQLAVGENAPKWLSEGLAEYVARHPLRHVSTATLAPRTEAQVRAHHLPDYLPLDMDFGNDPQSSYELSWLACRYIADTYGVTRLLALYRRMASLPNPLHAPQELSAAMEATLGVDERTFLAGWREALRRELSAS